MCGIFGFIGDWPSGLLERMGRRLAHRGPDGHGSLIDAEARLGLGHVRLAIIDPSEAGRQPMESACGRYVLSFNGEIYNFREIAATLAQRGVRFRGHSDSEVLLEAYAQLGCEALPLLRGIYAFALWDRQTRRLLLARDPGGVKPLYYSLRPQGLVFASELKALAALPEIPDTLDAQAVANHLGFIWSPGDHTMLAAVKKLMPGQTLEFALGEEPRFGTLPAPLGFDAPKRKVTVARAAAEFGELLDEVVREQMVSDVPVGALLSGGVDSSAVVASMVQAGGEGRLTTFCAVAEGGAADNIGSDVHYARMMAERLGVELICVHTPADVSDSFADMVWDLDEPTADFAAVQLYGLAREARTHGIKVLMSGVGGDDLLTGYPRHRVILLRHFLRHLPGLRLMAGLLRGIPERTLLSRRLQRVGALLALSNDEMAVESMAFCSLGADERPGLLSADLRRLGAVAVPPAFGPLLAASRTWHPVHRQLLFELATFLPHHNLNYADKMSMKAGVELRVPLLDPRLQDFAAQLPIECLISLSETKRVLRHSQATRLPQEILKRPKQGFGIGVRGWLAGGGRPLLEDLTSERVVAARGLFEPAAVAGLRRQLLDQGRDVALPLMQMMAIELWCRKLAEARR